MHTTALQRYLNLTAIIAGAALCLGASAQTLPENLVVEVPAHAVAPLSIDLPARPRYMMADDFKRFAGTYDLSNGDTLSLRRSGPLMYARIGNQDEHRIIASSANSFVALDRKLKVRIDHNDDGSVGGELVMMVPSKQLADGTQTGETIAALGLPAP